MCALLLAPLLALPAFLLGVLVWVILEHFLTTDVPPVLQHRLKFRFLHCMFLYVVTLGNINEKLGICSMAKFFRFFQDCMIIRNDPKLVVTNLRYGTVPVRLFQPKAASFRPRRGVIFYHGGGGILGSLDAYHSLCSFLARETDSVVLSVGYRMYPDYHSPTMIQDCINACIHFLKSLNTYGVDSKRVLVCGESVGGLAVALISQFLLNRSDLPRIRAQILIYPFFQAINLQLPSFQQSQNIPFLTRKFMISCLCNCASIDPSWQDAIVNGSYIPPKMWKKYQKWLSADNIPQEFKKNYRSLVPSPFNEAAYLEAQILLDVKYSPLIAEDEIFAQLPEAFLLSCENDILRDDTLLYKKRLEDQGVPVTWYHIEDGFHGSMILFDKKPFSFPCSLKLMNALVCYINGIQ
ncbi:PREDICTED: arylacetamide deacetylase-like 4 [Chrysochloris asiatica]|uniref:Arylacetamide deacetylase-like 4 n=1 Tax=Chrysochloris asiatica TaxID=185453 RepID=A0A9B0TT44_CHRAS|nr:PREDICTED: arylacetamide deacetylase-like 4 [Chrysochloris asiatica]